MSVFSFVRLSSCLLGATMALPAATALQTRSCTAGTPTAQSYTWNFRKEAKELLQDVSREAKQTSFHADKLGHFSSDVDWHAHALQLSQIRSDVNDMGAQLCRLETIKRMTSPWEQKAIDHTAPLIDEMANETEQAIVFLDGNQDYLFNPAYHAYAGELYQQSTRLAHTVNQFERYGSIHNEDLHLEKSLGLIKKS